MLKMINRLADSLLSILDTNAGFIISILFTIIVFLMITLGTL